MIHLKHILLFGTALLLAQCGWLGSFSGNSQTNSQSANSGTTSTIFELPTATGAQFAVYVPGPATVDLCWPATVTTTKNGLATNVTSGVTAVLSAPAQITFYSNSTCSNSTSSVVVPTGSASAGFWVRSNTIGQFTISASDPAAVFSSASVGISFANSNPAIPVRIGLAGSSLVTAQACTAFTATLYSGSGAQTSFPTATTVNLASSSTDSAFYAQAGCSGAAATSVQIGAGMSSTTFYHKNPRAGLVSLAANANSVYGDLNVLVVASTPSQIVVQGPSVVNTGACYPFTLSIKDEFDNSASAPSNVSVPLSTAGVGALYGDSSCSGTINSVSIPAGNFAAMFYYNSLSAGSATLTPNISGLTSSPLSITINLSAANAPSKLAFESPTISTSAGSCFGPLYVRVQDGNGNNLNNDVAVNLSNSGNATFYSDSACGASIVSTRTGAAFFVRDQKAEVLQLTANDSSSVLASASKSLTIGQGPLYQLVVLGSQSTFVAGSCNALNVAYTDPYLNPAPLTSPRAAILKELGLSTGRFFSDNACSAALPSSSGGQSLAFNSGQHQQTVWFLETKTGSARVEATDGSLNPATFNFTVQSADPAAAKLTKSPGTLAMGDCGGPFELTLFDAFNNISMARTPLAVGLNSSGGSFFADDQCSTTTNASSFAVGSSSVAFYFRPTLVGGVVGNILPPGGVTGGTFNVQSTPSGSLGKIAVVGVLPRSQRGPATTLVGSCLEFAVEAEDGNGNPTTSNASLSISLSERFVGTPPASPSTAPRFFSAAGCSTPVSGVTLAAGTNRSSFWYRGALASTVEILGTNGTLGSTAYPLVVNPSATTALMFDGPTSGVAGVCAGPFTITGVDSYNNSSPLPNGTQIALSGEGRGTFYSSSDCLSSINSVTINSPAVQGSFFYRNTRAEGTTLAAATSGLAIVSRTFAIVPASPSRIGFVGPTSALTGVCTGPLSLQIEDAFGNPVLSSVQRSFSLVQSGSIGIYSDGACSSATTTATIAPNQSTSSQIWLKGTATQTSSLTISQSGQNGSGFTTVYTISIVPTPCTGLVNFVGDPDLIKAMVNSKMPHSIYEKPMNTYATAKKVCELVGHPVVVSRSSFSTRYNRSGWHWPWNNTLSHWEPTLKLWITGNAGILGNEWLSNVSCGCTP